MIRPHAERRHNIMPASLPANAADLADAGVLEPRYRCVHCGNDGEDCGAVPCRTMEESHALYDFTCAVEARLLMLGATLPTDEDEVAEEHLYDTIDQCERRGMTVLATSYHLTGRLRHD